MSWFNPTVMSPALASQLKMSLSLHARSNPLEAGQALQAIRSLDFMQPGGNQAFSPFGGQFRPPGCGCIPQPEPQHSGAPAGKGLSKNPAGFPTGSVRTAGGYTIVPEGKSAAWKIFGPGQKATDTANTRVWGDPHVNEKDGTRWDFTKNSDFVLPDGTRINCQTTSEKGRSVSQGLTIANGADKVNITGLNGSKPATGEVTNDGYQWRAQHLASNPTRDTFRLGGDKDNVKWFKEGKGLITGAHYDSKTQTYQQKTDGKQRYHVNSGMRPPVGSNAWGNQLRGEITDHLAKMGMSPQHAKLFGSYMALDHYGSQLENMFGGQQFGGMGGCFGSWNQGYGAVGNMGDLVLGQAMAQQQSLGFRATGLWA